MLLRVSLRLYDIKLFPNAEVGVFGSLDEKFLTFLSALNGFVNPIEVETLHRAELQNDREFHKFPQLLSIALRIVGEVVVEHHMNLPRLCS